MAHFWREISGAKGSFVRLSDHPSTDTAVIFVHGFFGDAVETWGEFERLIDEGTAAQAYKLCDVFFYSYPSSGNTVPVAAENLAAFVKTVYPKPSAELFLLDSFTKGFVDAWNVPDTPRKTVGPYKKLVLVGHSMGGVLIRQMTWKVFRNDYKPDASPTRGELERASVVLFAPAQGGFRLQDEVGSALASLGLSLISLWYVAKRARAYKDLVSGSPILSEIKSATAKLAGATQEALCFRAYTAWGADEIIVYKSDYDELDTRHKPYIPGIDHGGVCKPTETFDVPLTWVADGIKRAK